MNKLFDDTTIIGKELEKTKIGSKDCSSVKNCSDCESFKECEAIQKAKYIADSDMLKVADFIDKNGTERVSPKEKSEHMKNMLKDEE